MSGFNGVPQDRAIDIRKGVPKGMTHVAGNQAWRSCRRLGVEFRTALVGMSGRRSGGHFSPYTDGVVVNVADAEKVQTALAEQIARTPPKLPGFTRGLTRRTTSEELAFWSMLRNCPDDRTAWLVYADWLQERGDGKNATAIREHFRPVAVLSYVGTVDASTYQRGEVAWRESLTEKCRHIPGGAKLVGSPCQGGRFKVMAEV